jgi:RsiW-degrading membrane proteinase PrsW (M82 family)
MMITLRWIALALIPALIAGLIVRRTDERREPALPLALTFALGSLFAGVCFFLEAKASAWTGLDARTSAAGDTGSLLFLFAFAAPIREAAKVAATWPAFRSRHFDEPYDGVVYAAIAALGFAAVENAMMLRAHPTGAIWIARALLALPAHVFFASVWGYALGRAKQAKRPGAIFPLAWLVATLMHGLYSHLVYGRGPGALVVVIPLLAMMGVVAVLAARDLRMRGNRISRIPIAGSNDTRLSRPSIPFASQPPSFRTVRDALRRADRPIAVRWIAYGAVVTCGVMVAGLAASIAFGHWAHIDFAAVDERDVATTAPVALLGSGVLLAFPISGFLIARASHLPTLLEPALASAVAILCALVFLGLAAPLALVFALAFSPVAWGLACAGAWVGRPAS